VSPPLLWPSLPQWPHTLSTEERQRYQTYISRLLSSGNATNTGWVAK
jgi:hypothetical protein